MALLQDTLAPADVNAGDYDAIFFTGGHAVMYDFPDSAGLQTRSAVREGPAAVRLPYCRRRSSGHRSEPGISQGHGTTCRGDALTSSNRCPPPA